MGWMVNFIECIVVIIIKNWKIIEIFLFYFMNLIIFWANFNILTFFLFWLLFCLLNLIKFWKIIIKKNLKFICNKIFLKKNENLIIYINLLNIQIIKQKFKKTKKKQFLKIFLLKQ